MRALCGLLIVMLTLGPIGMGMLLAVDAPIMEHDDSLEMFEETFSSDHGTRSAPIQGPQYVSLFLHTADGNNVMNSTHFNWINSDTADTDITFLLQYGLGTNLFVKDPQGFAGMSTILYLTGSGVLGSTVTITVRDGDGGPQVGQKTFEDPDFGTYTTPTRVNISIPFTVNNNYTFSQGHVIALEFSFGTATQLYYDSESHPSSLNLHCKPITDIEVETEYFNNDGTQLFYPNDLDFPDDRRKVLIGGDITDAFSYAVQDGWDNVYYIDYVELHIFGPEADTTKNATWKLIDGRYDYTWAYSVGIADGEYTITAHVFDEQGNEFTSSNTFNMSKYGVELTSPDQRPEEGKYDKDASRNLIQNETTTYEIKVWNIGNNRTTVEIGSNIVASKPPSGWTYYLEGDEIVLDSGAKSGVIENIDPGQGNYKVFYLTILGSGKDIGDYITITISAVCSEDATPEKVRTLNTNTVVSMRYDIDLVFDDDTKSQSKTVEIGHQASYDFYVTNNGGTSDTIYFLIGSLPVEWSASLTGEELQKDSPTYGPYYVQLASKDSTTSPITLTITTPSSGGDTTVQLDITGKSHGSKEQGDDPIVSDKITTTTTMTTGVKLELVGGREKSTDPDDSVQYQFELTNTGTSAANFTVTFSMPVPVEGWSSSSVSFASNYQKILEDFSNLNPNSPQTINLYIEPTINVPAGNYSITVTAEKDEDSTRQAKQDVFCIVNEKYDIQAIEPIGLELHGKAEPGKDVSYEIEIANYGNTAETVNIIIDKPSDWKVDFGNANSTWSKRLEPNQLEVIQFTFTVPEDAEGDQTVDITVSVVPVVSDPINIETHTEIESIWYQPLMMLLVPILLFVVIVVMVVVIYKRR